MTHQVARCLRPYLFHGFRRADATRAFSQRSCSWQMEKSRDVTHDYEKRVAQLQAQKSLADCYPRLDPVLKRKKLHSDSAFHTASYVKSLARELENGETWTDNGLDEPVALAGRIHSVRTAGSKLMFIDLKCEDETLQAVVQLGKLPETTSEQFKAATKTVRKGDWYAIIGWPHRTARGEPSVLANRLPELMSPSLHQVPDALDDAETRAKSRHVDMLVNPSSIQPLIVRDRITRTLRTYFGDWDFIEVTTPLLTAGAGGAVARPFETEATELEGQKLNLRIAPELWLKRLIVGGVPRVYEIGPAFRNEGVDATHNPEFAICEFYEAFATLEDLMSRTETLLADLSKALSVDGTSDTLYHPSKLQKADVELSSPYQRLEFVPTLEKQMGCSLPDLNADDAPDKILALFAEKDLELPARPTLPRLLDALAGHYLEPLCEQPTFIINHPAALSPLSKHFTCPTTGQVVAARAELFIRGREYANMYEEENSPFEQRRKFTEQLKYRNVDGEGDGRSEVDESYLEALEWGMPPTGGWGCGIDRLVMLFSGRERMADVLAFGSLRNVVGLGRKGR